MKFQERLVLGLGVSSPYFTDYCKTISKLSWNGCKFAMVLFCHLPYLTSCLQRVRSITSLPVGKITWLTIWTKQTNAQLIKFLLVSDFHSWSSEGKFVDSVWHFAAMNSRISKVFSVSKRLTGKLSISVEATLFYDFIIFGEESEHLTYEAEKLGHCGSS